MGETDCGGNWALAHFGGLQLLVTVTDLFTDMSGNSPFLIWLFYTSPVLWHLLRQGWLNSASQTSVCQMVTLANRWGNNGNRDFTWGEGLQNHCRWWLQPWNSKTLAPWKKSYDQPRQHVKKQRHYFANKFPSSQSYRFSSSHVWMWKLDRKESWALKNWCFWTVVLEKTFESPLDSKGIQSVNLKGNQSWIFIGMIWSWSSKTLATWCEELTHLKRLWCWERLKARGEGDDRGRDGWMALPTW